MINFGESGVFNLSQIDVSEVYDYANNLLIDDEKIVMAFKTIRDQLVFTTKRVISIDVQGITGKRRSFSSLPYSKVQYFAIQTAGVIDINSELFLMFSNGFTSTFTFKSAIDISVIGRLISQYVL